MDAVLNGDVQSHVLTPKSMLLELVTLKIEECGGLEYKWRDYIWEGRTRQSFAFADKRELSAVIKDTNSECHP